MQISGLLGAWWSGASGHTTPAGSRFKLPHFPLCLIYKCLAGQVCPGGFRLCDISQMLFLLFVFQPVDTTDKHAVFEQFDADYGRELINVSALEL